MMKDKDFELKGEKHIQMDITLCQSVGCPWGDKCKRQQERGSFSQTQSFAHFTFDLKENKCDFFIPKNESIANNTTDSDEIETLKVYSYAISNMKNLFLALLMFGGFRAYSQSYEVIKGDTVLKKDIRERYEATQNNTMSMKAHTVSLKRSIYTVSDTVLCTLLASDCYLCPAIQTQGYLVTTKQYSPNEGYYNMTQFFLTLAKTPFPEKVNIWGHKIDKN